MPDKIFPTISLALLTDYVSGKRPVESFYQDEKIKKLADVISKAFVEWGFVYLVDHGISEKTIESARHTSEIFFTTDITEKEKYVCNNDADGEGVGYVPFKAETFEKSRPFDLKECFNFLPDDVMIEQMKKDHPELILSQTNLFIACKKISTFLLRLLNLTLPVDTTDYLVSKHKHMGCRQKSATMGRILYYPPIGDKATVLKDQLRCGEHSDYGTFTLLFQDEVGGLQVVDPDGQYVDAVPIPGSIVVNVGDLLEIWSAGKFKSTRHRVIVPDTDVNVPRQSMVVFVHPDKDVLVSCLDGSENYKATNAYAYLDKRLNDTYDM